MDRNRTWPGLSLRRFLSADNSMIGRLLWTQALGVTAFWLIAALFVGLTIRHEIDEVMDDTLAVTARQILPFAVHEFLAYQDSVPLLSDASQSSGLDRNDPEDDSLFFLLREADGTIVMSSHERDLSFLPLLPGAGFTDTAGFRLYSIRHEDSGLVLEVGDSLEHRQEAIWESLGALMIPLFALLPLSLLGLWWYSTRSLRPLHHFSENIETRSAYDLTPLPTDDVPSELQPVAEAMNGFMEKLDRAISSEKKFAAKCAHELRSPVAACLAQVQRLIDVTESPEIEGRARQIADRLKGLGALSEKILQLAKSEGAGILNATPQPLSKIARHVLQDMEMGSAHRDRLKVEWTEGADLTSTLDPDAFAILLRNLVENALEHGDHDHPVTIHMMDDRRFCVENSGTQIDVQDIEARLADDDISSPAKGHGLGLHIVGAIIRGSGASIHVSDDHAGDHNKICMTVTLPH